MPNTMQLCKEYYSEQEAAESLSIPVERLHWLLDTYVFHDGMPKPANLNFRVTDLAMLGIWHRSEPTNLVRMPRRK